MEPAAELQRVRCAADGPNARSLLSVEQCPQTNATVFVLGGVTSLVMVVNPNSNAANAVASNPGHPHIGLWLASNDTYPMFIAVVPAWFPDGSPIYFYVPGESPSFRIGYRCHMLWRLHSSVFVTVGLPLKAGMVSPDAVQRYVPLLPSCDRIWQCMLHELSALQQYSIAALADLKLCVQGTFWHGWFSSPWSAAASTSG